MKKVLAMLLGLLLILSCGIKPPKDLESKDFIRSSIDIAQNILKFLNNFSAFSYLNSHWIPKIGLYKAEKGDKIYFNQYPWDLTIKPKTPYIFASTKNGKIILLRDMFLADNEKGDFIYSFDNITWFATDGDPKKYENFFPLANVNWEISDKKIDYNFSWAVREGSFPKKIIFDSAKRPIINLEPGMILGQQKKESKAKNNVKEIKLDNKILLLKSGQLIKVDIFLDSNFLHFYKPTENTALWYFYEEFNFYKKGWLISVSFDGQNWRDTILSYKFDFSSLISVNEKNEIVFSQVGSIINKKLLRRQKKNGQTDIFLKKDLVKY